MRVYLRLQDLPKANTPAIAPLPGGGGRGVQGGAGLVLAALVGRGGEPPQGGGGRHVAPPVGAAGGGARACGAHFWQLQVIF